uniref:Terpene synthase metal-binding domain-containing protein n=1 Tax=Salix viminalis TaxID=40686 RepID=A0A6N2KSV1_SALVM
MTSKYTKFVSLVDDAYDANASFMLHECYGNIFNETENDTVKQGRSYGSYYVEAFKEVVRGYHAEAEWADKCHVPTSDGFVLNELATCACGLLMAAFFLGLEEVAEVAGVEEYEWLKIKNYICCRTSPRGVPGGILALTMELRRSRHLAVEGR